MRNAKCSIAWAMPTKWTFQIPAIYAFVSKWIDRECSQVIIDPFCGTSTIGTHRNDLGNGGMHAEDFCDRLISDGVVADCVIFDPPYSPRQITECYASIGKKASMKDTQNSALYASVRIALAELLRPGGIALSFGWSSMGFGVQWPIEEVLLVQHGGAHNDTICVCQRKPLSLF